MHNRELIDYSSYGSGTSQFNDIVEQANFALEQKKVIEGMVEALEEIIETQSFADSHYMVDIAEEALKKVKEDL